MVGTLFNKEAAQRFKEAHLEAKQQQEASSKDQSVTDSTAPKDMATNAREASRVLQTLSSKQREQLLLKIADNLLAAEKEIMQENEKDCQVQAFRPWLVQALQNAGAARVSTSVGDGLTLAPEWLGAGE